MGDPTEPVDPPAEPGPAEPPGPVPLSAEARRRLAEVFGDVLPATTADERDDRDRATDPDPDARLLADRPPHHDREQ
jgi:hypothetical protein